MSQITLAGCTNSDWALSINDRQSISGYAFNLGSWSISWSSKKQPTVATSSTEAEYIWQAAMPQRKPFGCEHSYISVWRPAMFNSIGHQPLKCPLTHLPRHFPILNLNTLPTSLALPIEGGVGNASGDDGIGASV